MVLQSNNDPAGEVNYPHVVNEERKMYRSDRPKAAKFGLDFGS